MAEHHDHHHDIEDLDGLKPQELAAMRWQAIEAFNSAPGLSPMARRVGIALVNAMDAKTRNCFPSELRIAAQLGVNLVSVKKAKAELGGDGHMLIYWFNPGGPRHLCHYSFNWKALLRLSNEAKTRATKEMDERRIERRRGSHTATTGGSEAATTKPRAQPPENVPKVAVSNGCGSHLDRRGSQMATPVVAARLPELSHLTTHLDTSHLNTPSQSDGGLGGGLKPIDDELSAAARKAEAKVALEERKATPRKPICHYPSLDREFQGDQEVIEAIGRLGFDGQGTASSMLATKGTTAAREFILRKAS